MTVTSIDPALRLKGVGRSRVLATLMAVAAVLWIVVWLVIGPMVVTSAYRGESWPALNSIIEGRLYGQPLEWYLDQWNTLVLYVTSVVLGGALVAAFASRPTFFRRYVGEATPGALGIIRILTCGALLITTFWEDLASVALLPDEMRRGAGSMGLLYALPIGAESLVANASALRALQYATELFLFLGMIGWLTRFVIPVAALLHFVALGILVDYSFFWHQGLVPLYVLMVLAFTPCGDGCSVDRLWKLYRGHPVPDGPSALYGWSRYMVWVVLVLPYVQSGLSKVRVAGWSWWDATNMRSMFYIDTLIPREYDWQVALSLVSAPDVLFTGLGITTIVLEVGYVLVLFSRTARRILPVMMVGTHIGILLLQRILFFDLIVLQLVFLDFGALRARISRWLDARGSRMDVLFDGSCALCRRTVRLLRAMDAFGALEFKDFRQLNLDDYNRHHAFDLAMVDLDESMHVVSRRRVYRGYSAYRAMALAIPLLWPVAPLLFVPGISSLGRRVYGRVARHRLQIACDDTCAFEPAVGNMSGAHQASRVVRVPGFGFVAALSVLVALSVGVFALRFEFYPLTAWHLYAGFDRTGTIKYYKVMGRYETGQTSRARLEDGIGAMALDGRYLVTLDKCFGARAEVAVCEKFLVANGSAYNTRREPGTRLTHYEIQSWKWDFVSSPHDPDHGEMVNRLVVDLNSGRSFVDTHGLQTDVSSIH